MKIRLNEIPENGTEYKINRETAELNEVLADLIKSEAYDVDLAIQPLSSKDFSMNGLVKTMTHEQCSHCGENFKFEVSRKIREILMPLPKEDRTGKYAKSSVKASTDGDDELSVTHYKSNQFDLGEFIHEAIALDIPFNPICADCLKKDTGTPFLYDEKMGEDVKINPFESLKGIKLN